MRNLYINILFSTIVLVYGGKDCCRNIGKSKAALLGAIDTLHRTNRLLGECGQTLDKKVAFHARLSTDVTLGSSQTVIFDDVITNIGSAYDFRTGHFSAPNDGVYFFASTFLKTHRSSSLHLQMMKNNDMISKGHAAPGGYAEAGSMNAIVSLKRGDTVIVRHHAGSVIESIHGDWCFFSGYQVY
ncbi:complement C1q tumor necrosis factor-related protein 3-like [Mytilus edulis]|uniref:complement C1q tumor necrosis factor-related protein 3-like n=1 Tax=Mytilus edulis TaxID=6550 RepID=UPI0039F0A0FF